MYFFRLMFFLMAHLAEFTVLKGLKLLIGTLFDYFSSF